MLTLYEARYGSLPEYIYICGSTTPRISKPTKIKYNNNHKYMYNTIIARDTPQLRLPWIVGHYLWFILCPPTTTPRISKPTKIYATAYFYTLTIICTCITLIIARDTPQLRLPWIVGHYLWFILCPPPTTSRISKPTKIYATAYFYTLTIICTCITLS
jgi:hypothetical protein